MTLGTGSIQTVGNDVRWVSVEGKIWRLLR